MTIDMDTPWVEKYRPTSFDDIVSQNFAIKNLKEFIRSRNMPHMIFSGPAGTGKTSTALIIAKSLILGDEYYRDVLELNASDTVRMDYVRKIIKNFTNQNMIIGSNKLKIVILDEADNIPTQVQQALRRVIERTSTKVKFILLCNYINRIIDPIISRCAVFRFVNLPRDKIVERLEFISKAEKLSIAPAKKDKFFNTLFFISGGDLRKAINVLQMSVALELLKDLDINEILRISGFLDEHTLKQLIEDIQAKNFLNAREIVESLEIIDSRNFIRQISAILPNIKNIKPDDRLFIRAFLGEIDFRISQGGDQKIQLSSLIAEIIDKIKL